MLSERHTHVASPLSDLIHIGGKFSWAVKVLVFFDWAQAEFKFTVSSTHWEKETFYLSFNL